MSGARKENGDRPDPPKALAIVLACLIGLVAVSSLLAFISLLR